MEAIKFAILGVDRHTDHLLAALRKSDRLSLCGVCETQPALLNRFRTAYSDVPFFDDPREMILRQKPHAVLLWRDMGETFIDSILNEGIWLILRPPITGGLASAIRILKQAEKSKSGVFVWTPWLFLPCYESMCDWLSGQQIRSFLARTLSLQPSQEQSSSDGLLASSMYPYIFLAQKWLGLPEQIHCRQLFIPTPSAETETTLQYFCLTNLLYSQTIGLITSGINTGPQEDDVVVCSNQHQIRANPTQAVLFDIGGNSIASSHRYELDQARQISYTRLFEQVWQSYVEQRRSSDIELRRHLSVLAILEAAALSSRTGHPEQLVRIVEVNNIAALV